MFPQGSISSQVLFCLKVNNIIKSVLKGSEASLFIDDFALCIHTKSFPHAERVVQLCVNSIQDRVSNNGFKFSTSKTVCMHFCNQCKKNMLNFLSCWTKFHKGSDRSQISWCGTVTVSDTLPWSQSET